MDQVHLARNNVDLSPESLWTAMLLTPVANWHVRSTFAPFQNQLWNFVYQPAK